LCIQIRNKYSCTVEKKERAKFEKVEARASFIHGNLLIAKVLTLAARRHCRLLAFPALCVYCFPTTILYSSFYGIKEFEKLNAYT
jgi:hypothetical protein